MQNAEVNCKHFLVIGWFIGNVIGCGVFGEGS